jgi:hypothetical protein
MERDLNVPAKSHYSSPYLHTTSFRISHCHPRCIFLFCTCSWCAVLTRHEYNESYDAQESAAISITESHWLTRHYLPYRKATWKRLFGTSSPPPSHNPYETLDFVPLHQRSTDATYWRLLQQRSSDTNGKHRPTYSHPYPTDDLPSKSHKSTLLQYSHTQY